ncbi:hypothetical protein, partial [Photorhabdus sp. RM71S]|uniref:hypothetical protein n=1 Tax=Photorhabdus sp. RM71S TaxID=3342824 RepID=UPI0036DB98AF
ATQPDYYPLSAHEYLYVKVASLAALPHKCPTVFHALLYSTIIFFIKSVIKKAENSGFNN